MYFQIFKIRNNEKMLSFSQRMGLVPVATIIQIDSVNEALRNSLWNVLHDAIWSNQNFMGHGRRGEPLIRSFSRSLWADFLKKPVDQRPELDKDTLDQIRKLYFEFPWNLIYDFMEFVVAHFGGVGPLEVSLNRVLERELAGYRFVSGTLVQITDQQEIEMLEDALRDTQFSGVASHLQQALDHLADRDNPDYRN